MKKLFNRSLALLLALCLTLPMGNFGSAAAFAVDDQGQTNAAISEDTASEDAASQVTATEDVASEDVTYDASSEDVSYDASSEDVASNDAASEDVISNDTSSEEENTAAQTDSTPEADLHKQYAATLYEDGRLTAEKEGATFAYDKDSNSVVISGSKTDLTDNRILIDKEYDFSDAVIGRFSIDMAAPKKTTITVGFYLDEETDPFFTATLTREKADGTWVYRKDISQDVYDRKITGTHKVSFALLDNDKTPDAVSLSLKSFEFVKSSVPVVYFDIDEEYGTVQAMNSDEDHNTECYGDMSIRIPDGYEAEYGNGKVKAGKETYELDYIKGRGNSTWTQDKKPYKIKLAEKANLLGMGKQKHWVLLANYYDNSLLRNKITYWLGEQINQENQDTQGIYEFTPASVAVDVVMNGEYYGSYYLCEQIRVGDNRVELNEMDSDATDAKDITGGYFLSVSPLEHDADTDESKLISTKNGQEFNLEWPEYEGVSVNQTQMDYIKNYIQDVEDAIYGKEFKNSDGVYYGDLMDIKSTAYYYLLQEFSMNGDAYVTDSTYLYKTNDTYDENGNITQKGKLYWGPLWDFDYVAWGSVKYFDPETEGWTKNSEMWFMRLFENEEFAKAVAYDAWPALKEKLQELIKDGGQLDQYYEQIKDSADYNFELLGPSPIATDGTRVDGEEQTMEVTLTYEEEIARLKNWISSRIEWVDANIEDLVPSTCTVTFKLGSQTITQSELQEHAVFEFPTAPSKKGYTFTNWNISYHLTYEEYLAYTGMSEKELIEFEGKAFVNNLKKNGYDAMEEFGEDSALPTVPAVTIEPCYVKTSTLTLPTALYTGQPSYVVSPYDDSFEIPVGCVPLNAYTAGLTWTSSKPSVATVDNGLVTKVSTGTTTITVSCGSVKTTCKVTFLDEEGVEDKWPAGASLNYTSVTMKPGTYKRFYVKYDPAGCVNTADTRIISTNSKVVKVSETGVAQAVGAGTCLIETIYEGEILKCKVTVVNPNAVSMGAAFTSNGIKYKVTSIKSQTVTVVGAAKRTITKLTVPATVKYKEKTFKVTSIYAKAFCKYTKLKYVTLGANMQKICKNAFYGCTKLYSVKTAKKLIYIGPGAFASCPALRKVYIKTPSLKLYASSFKGIKAAAKVYVPKKMIKYYKTFIKKAKVVGAY